MSPKKISKNHQEVKELLKDKGKLFDVVMEAIGDFVSIQDLDMRIVYQNRAIKEVMGAHEGEFCYRIYERRDRLCDGCPMQESFKTGKASGPCLRTGISKEGVASKYELITAPLKNEKGKIVAGVEIVRDVAQRERVLKELKEKMEELENFQKLAVGRELKMRELKEALQQAQAEIEKLKKS